MSATCSSSLCISTSTLKPQARRSIRRLESHTNLVQAGSDPIPREQRHPVTQTEPRLLDESSITTDRAIADRWITIILAIEVVVILLYLYVFKSKMGMVMLSF